MSSIELLDSTEVTDLYPFNEDGTDRRSGWHGCEASGRCLIPHHLHLRAEFGEHLLDGREILDLSTRYGDKRSDCLPSDRHERVARVHKIEDCHGIVRVGIRDPAYRCGWSIRASFAARWLEAIGRRTEHTCRKSGFR